MLETVEINPAKNTDVCLIWLHGLGADGHDFEGLVPTLSARIRETVRFVFPHAPIRPVTINGGASMRSWYDILDFSTPREINMDQFNQSTSDLEHLINQEVKKGVSYQRIILAGFSQGGAVVQHVGLRHRETLGGIMALSTYMPTLPQLKSEISAVNKNIPILMAHGSEDPVVPLELAQQSRSQLIELGYQVDWFDYPMQHGICPEQVRDINTWIEKLLAQGTVH